MDISQYLLEELVDAVDNEGEQDIRSKGILKQMVKRFSVKLVRFRPGLEISVSNKDQKDYTYKLTKPVGLWPTYPQFKPEITPSELLKLGIYGGKIFNDCFREFPREWFEDALTSDKLSILKPMRKFNHFQVDDIMALRDWMDEEDSDENSFDQEDPRGFIQWYFRFYIGRRIPDIDRKQILRWQKFGKRFLPSLKNSCKEKDMKCKPKLRQSLIQWGYDSREI